jgi:hypothetical protein
MALPVMVLLAMVRLVVALVRTRGGGSGRIRGNEDTNDEHDHHDEDDGAN